MKSADVIALTRAAYRQGDRAGHKRRSDEYQGRIDVLIRQRDAAQESLAAEVAANGLLTAEVTDMRVRVEALEKRPESVINAKLNAEIVNLDRENERLTALTVSKGIALLAARQELRAALETARQERAYAEARRQDAEVRVGELIEELAIT